jgi:hypothetical protein
MRTASRLFSAILTVFASTAVACSTEDAEIADTSTDELATHAASLSGAYASETGPIFGLVLTSPNKFFADVDTGIRCVTTPCPSHERIEGTFTLGVRHGHGTSTRFLTLQSPSASPDVQHLLGSYVYYLAGNTLELSKREFQQSLQKQLSYCAQPSDCDSQDIIVPMCMGAFSCESNACRWNCGVPTGQRCVSSSTCPGGTRCSTEDGECLSTGMLAVCSGTCVENAAAE